MQGRDKWFRGAIWAVAAVAAVGLTGSAYAKHKHAGGGGTEGVNVSRVISLPGGQKVTSFDISFVDEVNGVYVLGDRTSAAVDVVDVALNQVINQVSNPAFPFAGAQASTATSGPDGVVIVGHNQIWAGDGNSTVKVFDLFTGGPIATVNTGGQFRVDEGCEDPKDNLVMFANNADTPPFATIFDASKFPPAIKVQIKMNGSGGTPNATNGAEQCQYSSVTGTFFLSIPEVNGPGNNTAPGAVAEISPAGAVLHTYSVPLSACVGPAGMAISGTTVMLGCSGGYNAAAIDAKTGALVATLNDEGGNDEIWFNSGDDTFYFAQSSPIYSFLQRLGVVDDTTFTPDLSYATGVKSGLGGITRGTNHSVAADSVTNQIYVPISSTSGGDICSTFGGSDAQGCIAVFR